MVRRGRLVGSNPNSVEPPVVPGRMRCGLGDIPGSNWIGLDDPLFLVDLPVNLRYSADRGEGRGCKLVVLLCLGGEFGEFFFDRRIFVQVNPGQYN